MKVRSLIQLQVEVAVREEQTDAVVCGGHLHVGPVSDIEHLVDGHAPPVRSRADPAAVLLRTHVFSIEGVALGIRQDVRQLVNGRLILWVPDDRGTEACRVVRATEGTLAGHIHVSPRPCGSVCFIGSINVELYLAGYSEARRIAREWLRYSFILVFHRGHGGAPGRGIIYGVCKPALAVPTILLVVFQQDFGVI